MEPWFDRLTRSMGAEKTRRGLLKQFGAGVAAALLGARRPEPAGAQTPQCSGPGGRCSLFLPCCPSTFADCINGICVLPCPFGQTSCGAQCCDNATQTCDPATLTCKCTNSGAVACGGRCCPSGQSCSQSPDPQQQICCPTGQQACAPADHSRQAICCPTGQVCSQGGFNGCVCPNGGRPCGSICCGPAAICSNDGLQDVCLCPRGTACGNNCCFSPQVCINPATGSCGCPNNGILCQNRICCAEGCSGDPQNPTCVCFNGGSPCGSSGVCCDANHVCASASPDATCICREGTVCGNSCCPPGQACSNPSLGTCATSTAGRCPTGETSCDDIFGNHLGCCIQGETCTGQGCCSQARLCSFSGRQVCCPPGQHCGTSADGSRVCLCDSNNQPPCQGFCCGIFEVCSGGTCVQGNTGGSTGGQVTCPPNRVPCLGGCCPSGTSCTETGCFGTTHTCPSNEIFCSSPFGGLTCCLQGQDCIGGACRGTPNGTSCPSPNTLCPSGACVNTQTDRNNCGTCGHICQSGQTCSGGVCSGGACIPSGQGPCSQSSQCCSGSCNTTDFCLPTPSNLCC